VKDEKRERERGERRERHNAKRQAKLALLC